MSGLIAHQFEDAGQQHSAAVLGMWVFLTTEVLFFGGLFAGYAVYRSTLYAAFAEGSRLLDLTAGTANTAVLITSSLTMALAVRSAQRGGRRSTAALLIVTLLLGGVFLAIKGLEYGHKVHEHLVPGAGFSYDGAHAGGVELYFSFYFLMTGLHAAHMLIGIGVMAVLAVMAARGRFGPDHYAAIEAGGLYWHFVDVVWIFLFPMLYLVGRHA